MQMWRRFVELSLVLAALVGCSTPPVFDDALDREIAGIAAINPDTFVGTLADGEVFVAVVNRGGEVTAYLCDGTPGEVGVSVWLEGRADGARFAASNPEGTVRLEGTQNGSTLELRVTGLGGGAAQVRSAQLDQVTLNAAAHPAGLWLTYGGLDGFAEKRSPFGELYRAGWIVLPDGSQRGAANKPTGAETTQPVDTETGQNGEGGAAVNAEPTPAGPADPDLCRNYQGNYQVMKEGMRDGDIPREGHKRAKEIMRLALQMWNAECRATYGDINTAVVR